MSRLSNEIRGNGHAAPTEPIEEPWPEPLADAAFHGPLGALARIYDPITEADQAAVLTSLLAAFGVMCGHGPALRMGAVTARPVLNVLIVGKSAKARKGTSFEVCETILEQIDPTFTSECVVHGLSTGEGLIWEVHDEVARAVFNEKAGALEQRVVESNVVDKRRLIHESEMALVFAQFARKGNTLSPVLRRAWDQPNLRTMTKHEPAKATGTALALVGHVVKDELLRVLDRTELVNGFCNRMLFVCSKRSKLLPFPDQPVDAAEPVERLREALFRARQIAEVCWTHAARPYWGQIYARLSADRDGLWGYATNRAEAQVQRLAVVYALADGLAFIEPEHLTAALAVWRYNDASARFVFGSALGDPVADQIMRSLQDSPRGLTKTDIRDLFGRNRTAEEIGAALMKLRERGLAESHVENTGGRPAERWVRVARPTAVKWTDVGGRSDDGGCSYDLEEAPYVVSVIER